MSSYCASPASTFHASPKLGHAAVSPNFGPQMSPWKMPQGLPEAAALWYSELALGAAAGGMTKLNANSPPFYPSNAPGMSLDALSLDPLPSAAPVAPDGTRGFR